MSSSGSGAHSQLHDRRTGTWDRVPTSVRARRRVVNQAIGDVSDHLGNTPTVARTSYVDPRVVERFEEGATVLAALRRVGGPEPADDAARSAVESAVVRLLRRS